MYMMTWFGKSKHQCKVRPAKLLPPHPPPSNIKTTTDKKHKD